MMRLQLKVPALELADGSFLYDLTEHRGITALPLPCASCGSRTTQRIETEGDLIAFCYECAAVGHRGGSR